MFTHYRTQGLIIEKNDIGEADQVFGIFTKDFGKLEIIGKAIRKITSKLKSGAELFYLSDIEFIQGKTQKTLTDAVKIDKFKNIRNDIERLAIANNIVRATNNLIRGQEKDERIWNLLQEVFFRLNDSSVSSGRCSFVYYYFCWNLLSLLGYEIDLYKCAVCHKTLLPQKLCFNPKEGGIIDETCYKRTRKDDSISPNVIKILRIILKKDWNTLLNLKINDNYENSLGLISQNYLSYLTHKE